MLQAAHETVSHSLCLLIDESSVWLKRYFKSAHWPAIVGKCHLLTPPIWVALIASHISGVLTRFPMPPLPHRLELGHSSRCVLTSVHL